MEDLVKELAEKMKMWKQRNEEKRCAICGRPLERVCIDAFYQTTVLTREVRRILIYWSQIPSELREWLISSGIAVCTEHLAP